jgi:hypothetical protein
MKRQIVLTIFSLLQVSFIIQGQTIEIDSEWRVDNTRVEIGEDWIRYSNYYRDFIDGDTVLNSHEYFKIYRSGYQCKEYIMSPPPPPVYTYYNHSLTYLLREENNRWYAYYWNVDHLIYDFNLDTGDTLVSFLASYCYNDTVVAVDSVLIDGDYKKRLYLNLFGAEYIIEGIGATSGLFEPFCQFEYHSDLVCYARNGISLWGETTEECDLAVNIDENFREMNLDLIYPNPCKDFITLSVPSELGRVSCTLYNALGILVCQDFFESPSTNRIDVRSLPRGIYFATLVAEGLTHTTKLIVR